MSRLRAVLLVSCLVATATLSATVVVPTEFREVVSDATLIVRGRVSDVRAQAIDGRGIESIASVAVESVLKGQAEGFVSVRVPGGTVGRTSFVMVGAPRLAVDERAVFFLKRDAENAWRPVGLSMGIYRLQLDKATGQPVVNPPIVSGTTASATGPIVRGDVRRTRLLVPEFEALVRLVMTERSGVPQ